METPTLRPKRDRRTQHRITPEDVARRAYELFEQRGGEQGHDSDDWFQAEQELQHRASTADDVSASKQVPS